MANPLLPRLSAVFFVFLTFGKTCSFLSPREFNEIISPAKPSECTSKITWGKPYATYDVVLRGNMETGHTVWGITDVTREENKIKP